MGADHNKGTRVGDCPQCGGDSRAAASPGGGTLGQRECINYLALKGQVCCSPT
jgi:hypothetical protein